MRLSSVLARQRSAQPLQSTDTVVLTVARYRWEADAGSCVSRDTMVQWSAAAMAI